jgi:hypothetical protein
MGLALTMKWQGRRRLFHAVRFSLSAPTSTDFRSIGISALCFIKEGLALSRGEAELAWCWIITYGFGVTLGFDRCIDGFSASTTRDTSSGPQIR